MKILRLITTLIIVSNLNLVAQLNAYYSSASYNTPNNTPYIDVYLTLVGKGLKAKNVNANQFQNKVLLVQTIYKDSLIVKANKYKLSGPLFTDTLNPPTFLDAQRYSLPNGNYLVVTDITDANATTKKTITIKEKVEIKFQSNQLSSSSIQLLEKFQKSTTPTILTRSGFDLTPYCINYYPETQKELSFYLELYKADSILGKNKNFIFKYYIENKFNSTLIDGLGAFKKQTTANVNPLLAKVNIENLYSGNYNLVVEVIDENNILQFQTKQFFQRLNKKKNEDLYEFMQTKTIQEYFGQCSNLDTLKMFVECLWPIANNLDKDRIINAANKKDADVMKKYVVNFWERYAADTANPLKLWSSYYREVQKVMKLFKCGKQAGYYTDRGRVYLQYGAPNIRSEQLAEQNTYPYEIWQYYRLTDKTNAQFYSNKRFVFVNKTLADDCFMLIHSDVRGEVLNDRWRFEVTRRNTNGISNPDNVQPGGTESNSFNQIFANPQ